MEKVIINKKEYQYCTNYKNDENLRNSFYSLTRRIWNFDFKKWYNSGYWEDNCLLYSLLDGNKMVSHITVSVIDFIVLDENKRFVQLGTVSTDEDYRKQGLNKFLLKKVLQEWNDKSDLIYLYANDQVLDYYPRFGFTSINEYQAIKKTAFKTNHSFDVRKINLDNPQDHKLLYDKAKNAVALFQISMVDNAGLIMFYCNYFDKFSFKENLFYIKSLDAIVVAEYKESDLILYDILSTQKVEIDDIINAMATDRIENTIMHFIPINNEGYEIKLLKEEDTTLFVLGNNKDLLEKNKLIFPILSHT